ncbi:MAG: hypothetical protein ABIF82_01335 [Planctomycetota bacterium]
MRTTSHWITLFVAVALFGGPCALAQDVEKKKAYVQGYDVLALPGEEVALRAKAERGNRLALRPDIEGATLEFYGGGKLLGSAKTDDDGIAAITRKYEKPWRHFVTVKFGAKSKYRANEAALLVDVCDAKTRFIVCDIDHTIADVSATKFVFKKNENVPALPGSPEALARLSIHYNIIYVTARDDAFLRKTKDWLALRKFPHGPVFFWDFLGKEPSHEKYKTREIADLKKRFPNIVAGVGDKVSDANAYLANGLNAIIIGPERDDGLPAKAIWVKTWAEIEKLLKAPDALEK